MSKTRPSPLAPPLPLASPFLDLPPPSRSTLHHPEGLSSTTRPSSSTKAGPALVASIRPAPTPRPGVRPPRHPSPSTPASSHNCFAHRDFFSLGINTFDDPRRPALGSTTLEPCFCLRVSALGPSIVMFHLARSRWESSAHQPPHLASTQPGPSPALRPFSLSTPSCSIFITLDSIQGGSSLPPQAQAKSSALPCPSPSPSFSPPPYLRLPTTGPLPPSPSPPPLGCMHILPPAIERQRAQSEATATLTRRRRLQRAPTPDQRAHTHAHDRSHGPPLSPAASKQSRAGSRTRPPSFCPARPRSYHRCRCRLWQQLAA